MPFKHEHEHTSTVIPLTASSPLAAAAVGARTAASPRRDRKSRDAAGAEAGGRSSRSMLALVGWWVGGLCAPVMELTRRCGCGVSDRDRLIEFVRGIDLEPHHATRRQPIWSIVWCVCIDTAWLGLCVAAGALMLWGGQS